MRKMTRVLNAGSFKSVKFRATVKRCLASDHTFSFMNTISNFSNGEKLGIPKFFLTLSSGDLRRNEILAVIRKLNEADFDISSQNYTHLNGSHIDQVFVAILFLQTNIVSNVVISTYFSDHDEVCINF